jgi:hypothetical protein
MDGNQFDNLARGLGARIGRRRLVQATAALLAGGASVGAIAGPDASAAARRTCRAVGASCSRGSQCCTGTCPTSGPRATRNRCTCPDPDATVCSGDCVVLADDVNHCGACGHACHSGQECFAGRCMTPCDRPAGVGLCFTRPDDTTVYACSTYADFNSQNQQALQGCAVDSDCVRPAGIPESLDSYCFVGGRVDPSLLPAPGYVGQFIPVSLNLLAGNPGVCWWATPTNPPYTGTCPV